jgi:hypothetical protein
MGQLICLTLVLRATLERVLGLLALLVGDFSVVSGERMEEILRALDGRRGCLPVPNRGGAVANTEWGL